MSFRTSALATHKTVLCAVVKIRSKMRKTSLLQIRDIHNAETTTSQTTRKRAVLFRDERRVQKQTAIS